MTEEKRSRKKKQGIPVLPTALAGALLLLAICLGIASVRKHREENAPEQPAVSEEIPQETVLSEEEILRRKQEAAAAEEIASFRNLGIVNTDGFINMRSAPTSSDMTNIIGLLNNNAAFDLLEDQGEWLLIESGGLTGYVASRYCLTGDEAAALAKDLMDERCIVTAEVLNIRSSPEISSENIVGKARAGERYRIVETEGDWALVECSYISGTDTPYINISGENCEIRYCLDEARNRDLRELALTQFDQIVVCNAESFINIRKDPSSEGIANICGKFLRGNGAELLDTVESNGRTWLKIRSGNVTGYAAAEYCAVGPAARDLALQNASLTARIKTDNLNVRTGPSTEYKAWTKVVTGQSYRVLDQEDGWVKIDLDSDEEDNAYISTQKGYVELTYGLAEAVEYYPAVEAANKAAAFRNKIVNYACEFVGNPYVWGGTSLTNGCDCSGFVQSVMKKFGIRMERTSVYQAKQGVRVTSDKMKPGDLIFYANSSGTINHVGIYIGNGYMVNAASKRSGIKIYRWNYRTPAAIRNVIGD